MGTLFDQLAALEHDVERELRRLARVRRLLAICSMVLVVAWLATTVVLLWMIATTR